MSDITRLVDYKRAIIFDLFHTLTAIESNWGPMTHEILGFTHEEWDSQLLENSPERLTGQLTDPTEIISTLARRINPDIDDTTIAKAVESRLARFAKAVIEIPEETVNTLKILRYRGKKIGLISNAEKSEVLAWPKSPISPLFDVALFSCDVGMLKPQPEIYQKCLQILEVKPEDAIFVGDGGSGELDGARRVGLTAVMLAGIVGHTWPDKIEKRKSQADYVVENIAELVDFR